MKLKIKLFAVAAFLAVAACVFLFSNNRSQAQADKTAKNRDAILQTVAGYKAWKQVLKPEKKTDEPETIINSTGMGWGAVGAAVFPGSGKYPGSNSTGSTQILSSRGTTSILLPNERIFEKDEKEPANPHEKGVTTFARYYANELAQSEIYKDEPKFPVGSVIVREKLVTADAVSPELVTVMVKREKGFSPKTGDWEYLVVEGGLGKISRREKVGSCSKCHANAAQTDFVFKSYLK